VTQLRMLLVAALAVIGLALPGAVGARTAATPLTATVGSAAAPDAFQISLTDATGARVTHLDPGAYTITVHDYSTIHNFALSGPGVSQHSDLDAVQTLTWEVTFSDGTYNYVCQAHPGSMKGNFTVGTVTQPPPKPKVKKLSARVGPGRTISLRTASGARVKSLKAGKYRIAVKDATAADNFHLLGRGVNKKTGVKFKGSVTWSVTLRKGKLSYRSDAHRSLRGTITVR
jgi:plastocyanin